MIIIMFDFLIIIRYFSKRLREIKNSDKEDEKKFIKKNKFIMYSFPLILIITKVPATINRSISILYGKSCFGLYFLQSVCAPLMGIFNSLVFFYIHKPFINERNTYGNHENYRYSTENEDI